MQDQEMDTRRQVAELSMGL